jgi:hypothetical protein
MAFNFTQSFTDTQWQLFTDAMGPEHAQPEAPASLPAEQPEWSSAELATGLPRLLV